LAQDPLPQPQRDIEGFSPWRRVHAHIGVEPRTRRLRHPEDTLADDRDAKVWSTNDTFLRNRRSEPDSRELVQLALIDDLRAGGEVVEIRG
jgi:hypothetical protein